MQAKLPKSQKRNTDLLDLPEANIIAAFALVKESIDAVNRGTFMIPAQEEEVLRIPYFVCKEEAYRLN